MIINPHYPNNQRQIVLKYRGKVIFNHMFIDPKFAIEKINRLIEINSYLYKNFGTAKNAEEENKVLVKGLIELEEYKKSL